MRQFTGKQALLTGAAGGIGRALAFRLAEAGCQLWLVDIDSKALSALADDLRSRLADVRISVIDITQRDQLKSLAQQINSHWRGLDLLINNAGIAYYGPTHQMSERQWDRLMAINLDAPIHLTRLLMPALMSRDDSHIVNMCSISGLVAGGRFNAYHTSKFGLVGFTEALRAEYGRSGLGVTAICPGPVQTNLYRDCETGRGNGAPEPPAWLCASPDKVARVTLRAIRWNRRMALVSPMAHLLYQMKRFVPGLIDMMNTFSRRSIPILGRRYQKPRPSLDELLARQTEVDGTSSSRKAA